MLLARLVLGSPQPCCTCRHASHLASPLKSQNTIWAEVARVPAHNLTQLKFVRVGIGFALLLKRVSGSQTVLVR